jgi:hypothetical protein
MLYVMESGLEMWILEIYSAQFLGMGADLEM